MLPNNAAACIQMYL